MILYILSYLTQDISHTIEHAKEHAARLAALHTEGKLISYVDPTPFRGLEDVAAAVDYMYSGRNIGNQSLVTCTMHLGADIFSPT